MFIFTPKGNITDKELMILSRLCDKEFENQILIPTDNINLEFNLDPETINSVSSVVSILISVISLVVSIKKDNNEATEKNTNNFNLLKSHLDEYLKKYGVNNYSITKIEGFNEFLKGKGSCNIYISASQSEYYITMSKQGNTNVIQLA